MPQIVKAEVLDPGALAGPSEGDGNPVRSIRLAILMEDVGTVHVFYLYIPQTQERVMRRLIQGYRKPLSALGVFKMDKTVLEVNIAPRKPKDIPPPHPPYTPGKHHHGPKPCGAVREEPFKLALLKEPDALVFDREHLEELERALPDQLPFAFTKGKDAPDEV